MAAAAACRIKYHIRVQISNWWILKGGMLFILLGWYSYSNLGLKVYVRVGRSLPDSHPVSGDPGSNRGATDTRVTAGRGQGKYRHDDLPLPVLTPRHRHLMPASPAKYWCRGLNLREVVWEYITYSRVGRPAQ